METEFLLTSPARPEMADRTNGAEAPHAERIAIMLISNEQAAALRSSFAASLSAMDLAQLTDVSTAVIRRLSHVPLSEVTFVAMLIVDVAEEQARRLPPGVPVGGTPSHLAITRVGAFRPGELPRP